MSVCRGESDHASACCQAFCSGSGLRICVCCDRNVGVRASRRSQNDMCMCGSKSHQAFAVQQQVIVCSSGGVGLGACVAVPEFCCRLHNKQHMVLGVLLGTQGKGECRCTYNSLCAPTAVDVFMASWCESLPLGTKHKAGGCSCLFLVDMLPSCSSLHGLPGRASVNQSLRLGTFFP